MDVASTVTATTSTPQTQPHALGPHPPQGLKIPQHLLPGQQLRIIPGNPLMSGLPQLPPFIHPTMNNVVFNPNLTFPPPPGALPMLCLAPPPGGLPPLNISSNASNSSSSSNGTSGTSTTTSENDKEKELPSNPSPQGFTFPSARANGSHPSDEDRDSDKLRSNQEDTPMQFPFMSTNSDASSMNGSTNNTTNNNCFWLIPAHVVMPKMENDNGRDVKPPLAGLPPHPHPPPGIIHRFPHGGPPGPITGLIPIHNPPNGLQPLFPLQIDDNINVQHNNDEQSEQIVIPKPEFILPPLNIDNKDMDEESNHIKQENFDDVQINMPMDMEPNLLEIDSRIIPSTGVSNGETSASSATPKKKKKKRSRKNTADDASKKYFCDVCGKRYKYSSNLRTHAKIHTDQALECHFCHKKFGRRANYNEHLRVHTGETPFQCRFCGKNFKQHHGWRDHERIHTGEKPYVCEYCGKRFTVGHNLAVHKRIHTGEKPYKCTHCGKRFRQKSAYNSHIKHMHS